MAGGDSGLRERIMARAEQAGLTLETPLADGLSSYLDLLWRWNRTINLTGLSTLDAAIDRLILEPVAAARWLPESSGRLLDIGSGGGSPAIPLKLAAPYLSLTLVEVKERKAAFLREAIRVLKLSATTVQTARYQELLSTPGFRRTYHVVSLRAISLSGQSRAEIPEFLVPGGLMLWFHGTRPQDGAPVLSRAETIGTTETVPLLHATGSSLTLIRRQDYGS